jgi:hypothetical protein
MEHDRRRVKKRDVNGNEGEGDKRRAGRERGRDFSYKILKCVVVILIFRA